MQLKRSILFAVAGALALAGQAVQATVALFDCGVNIDGTVSQICLGDPVPGGLDLSNFNTTTGIGTIKATITGAGAHNIDLFLDHEIDEAINTFYNEYGAAPGVAAAGQSWEIDEPGYFFGDIFDNFLVNALDNSNGVPATDPEDVSMALGWDFILGSDQTAFISFLVSEAPPTSGFYLTQTDPNSQASIYFSSSLTIRGTGQEVPLPATLLLLAAGALGMGRFARGARR